jgi:hypothetical protein
MTSAFQSPRTVYACLAAAACLIVAGRTVNAFQTGAQATAAASANCVTIGAPKPALQFSYRYTDSSGSTDFTNQWKQFSATGSQLVTVRASGQSTYVSTHSVVDDVFMLESSTASGVDPGGPFNNSMTYSPGAMGDPAFRACEGKTWTIAAVNATSQSGRGSFSAKTDPGTMRIVSTKERVTVPAGAFDTVHYVKTMKSSRGQVVDEFWKSIDHGVTVKRTSTQPGSVATELLTAVK